MENVVVFGDLPIATKIVQYLETLSCNIFIVIGNINPNNNDPWTDTPLLFEYAVSKNYPIITLSELSEKYEDSFFSLGLSCRFSKIIKRDVLCKFRNGILNMHGGLLPEFGGLFSANHTILSHSKIGGGTIHYIDEGIDSGEILKRCSFNIQQTDTSYTVFQKTQKALYDGILDLIPEAINNRLKGKLHSDFVKEGYSNMYYDRHSLEGLKEIKIEDLFSDDAEYIIRAFDFPGYEPAYFINSNGEKIYLRTTY